MEVNNQIEKLEFAIVNLKTIQTNIKTDRELDERIEILDSALEKINLYKEHKLFKYEVEYQMYRIKFSKAYI